METSAPHTREPRIPAYGRQNPVKTGRPFTWPKCQDWAAGAKFPLAMLASHFCPAPAEEHSGGRLVLWFGPHCCDPGLRQPWYYSEHGLPHTTLALSATALSSVTCEQPALSISTKMGFLPAGVSQVSPAVATLPHTQLSELDTWMARGVITQPKCWPCPDQGGSGQCPAPPFQIVQEMNPVGLWEGWNTPLSHSLQVKRPALPGG